ncbi:MAG: hypothetical protein L6R41_002880 [Letrouitia leprolyta]|nr:MAG: hypothetical protein L6R41_002880 [Letrouitia leprolyta]
MAAIDQSLTPSNDPDIMNDPSFDRTQHGGRRKSLEDPDTCRICRAEASDEEPLFYPCKCSGSIKFVHQNCLMEWLSHSQKKHCELCKTPFRFTKLYHPHMPTTVPPLVFLRQVVIHTWKSLVAWSRMQLVLFVWLGWLPWSMRTVWRGMFWIGDGGWFDWARMEQEALKAAKERLDKLAAEGMSPVPPKSFFSLRGRDTASLVVSRIAEALPQMVSRNLSLTGGQPVAFRLARDLLRRFTFTFHKHINETATLPQTPPIDPSYGSNMPYRSSWLSDIRFLRTLTRYPIVNSIIINTLEGQLITLFIVVAFILVFLIREWVVQQRPIINARAGPEAPVALPAIEDGNRQEEVLPEVIDNAQQEPNEAVEDSQNEDREQLPPTSQPDSPQPKNDSDDSGSDHYSARANVNLEIGREVRETLGAPENSSTTEQTAMFQHRPSMPDRGTLARAAEIRRTIEEQSRATGQDWPGLKIFMDLWHRAGNKPDEVLRIIEEEGRGEELSWVIAAMGRLENIPISATDQSHQGKFPREGPSNDVQSDGEVKDGVFAESDLARRIYGSEFDFAKGMGSNASLESVSNTAQWGSPALTERGQEARPIGEDVATFDTAETTKATSTDLNDQPNDVADTSNQPLPNSSPHPVDNPFHEDYAGPLPPRPQGIYGEEELIPAAEDTNAAVQEQDRSPEEADHQVSALRLETNQPLIERIMTWLWGAANLESAETGQHAAGDDEHIVRDLANEAPFIPMEHGQPLINGEGQGDENRDGPEVAQDPQVAEEAIQAGLDPNEAEAVEEVEDLEGVMELVGMQGPIAGLIQNGMFCAVLVSLTILVAIWMPYIMGKVFFIILANPVSFLIKLPLRWASSSADLLSDALIFSVTCSYYWIAVIVSFLCRPAKKFGLIARLLQGEEMLADAAKGYAEKSLGRLTDAFTGTSGIFSESDIPTFSIVAHESLQSLRQHLLDILESCMTSAMAVCTWDPQNKAPNGQFYQHLGSWQAFQKLIAMDSKRSKLLSSVAIVSPQSISAWFISLKQVNFLRLSVSIPQRTQPLDYRLAFWDSKDRTIAVIFGYLTLALIGILYLQLSRIFRNRKEPSRAEGVLAEVLYQAGGVAKVILIISIEMIVFPLYCGFLLDVALLPLFRDVTLLSRLEFMVSSPYTSLFVHWFVGTCYMFHFALFVSMCRKIMRNGVLYFIRDPDDPTFHPVRDVLERSVFTQLGKIAFSALVYGGLVIICLGGVVWGISSAFDGVFPIHWSSNQPVLEYPVDLLFYNLVIPLAVKYFRPSETFSELYAWWFRKCARGLRLSHFLFGEKKSDEEGRHIRRTWKDLFTGQTGDTDKPVIGADRQQLAEDRELNAFFLRDGKYVRAPASDQVRIPKGSHTFVEVDEDGNRVDGQPDNDQGLHGRKNDQFSTFYIPPYFRFRISAFIFLLWLFAAATSVCATILPLLFGRYVFSHAFPSHSRMNDIYAFSIGLHILSGATFLLIKSPYIFAQVRQAQVHSYDSKTHERIREILRCLGRFLRLLYTYSAFALLLPSLCALIVEFYLVAPLHTYVSKGIADHHTIFFIQDWTLGILFVQLIGRLILYHEQSRPAAALRNIVRRGWANPDARLATRGFIFPAIVLTLTLLLVPLGSGWLANEYLFEGDDQFRTAIFRYSYPGVLLLGVWVVVLYYATKAFKGWKRRIRDEVYLIGERLHNFGERRTGNSVGGTRVGM